MNRIDWLLWGYKLLIGAYNLEGVKTLVAELTGVNDLSGAEKRQVVEENWLSQVQDQLPVLFKEVGVFLLRSLIELLLAQLTVKRS